MSDLQSDAHSIERDSAAVTIEPIALPIDEAATACGIARTRIYDAISKKEITARKSGRATIIEVAELRRWIHSLPTRGRTPLGHEVGA
jgi:excisionase family DNA binding protein